MARNELMNDAKHAQLLAALGNLQQAIEENSRLRREQAGKINSRYIVTTRPESGRTTWDEPGTVIRVSRDNGSGFYSRELVIPTQLKLKLAEVLTNG